MLLNQLLLRTPLLLLITPTRKWPNKLVQLAAGTPSYATVARLLPSPLQSYTYKCAKRSSMLLSVLLMPASSLLLMATPTKPLRPFPLLPSRPLLPLLSLEALSTPLLLSIHDADAATPPPFMMELRRWGASFS